MENEIKLVQEMLSAARHVTVASFSVRLWQYIAPCAAKGFDLYCRIDDPVLLAEMGKNGRIGFIVGQPGRALRGQGIARPVEGADVPDGIRDGAGQAVLIQPYRIHVAGAEELLLERSKQGWAKAAGLLPARKGLDLQFWLRASRFVSAPLSLVPVIAGSLLAFLDGAFHPAVFLAALAGGLAAHLGTNLLSDYNDFRKGYDTPGALSSHTGVLVQELIEPSKILAAGAACFLVTALSGIYLIAAAGWGVLLFGAAGVAGGLSYTGGPFALKYRGLGELLTSFLMGPLMVMGAYFVQTGRLHLSPFLVSLALGLLVGSVTLANNLRDMVDDGANGFETLPHKIGFEPARKAYYLFLAVPFLCVLALIALQPRFTPAGLAFLSLPFAVTCIREIKNGGSSAPELRLSAMKHPYPLNSIRLYQRFSLYLLAGLALSFLLR